MKYRFHTSDDYAGFEHIDRFDGLKPNEQECLTQLATVVLKNNAEKRFGVSLLHQHFSVNTGEVMLETRDTEQRVLCMQPVSSQELVGKPLIPVNFKLSSILADSAFELVGLEYVEALAAHEVEPVNDLDVPIISQLHDVLDEFACLNRFGLALARNECMLEPGEVFLEICNIEKRTLISIAQTDASFEQTQMVDTRWFFRQSLIVSAKCRLEPVLRCVSRCQWEGDIDHRYHRHYHDHRYETRHVSGNSRSGGKALE